MSVKVALSPTSCFPGSQLSVVLTLVNTLQKIGRIKVSESYSAVCEYACIYVRVCVCVCVCVCVKI